MKINCLILSQGPVPTPEHTKVEGGGLRCWGLAKGLKANDPNLNVTVAYHESYKQTDFSERYEDISIMTWNLEHIPKLIEDYDSIIVSYCMGDLSVKVANSIRPDQQLVLDCYVPIYIEASARNSDNLEKEYADFHADVGRWARVLRRGDIFLCASDQQKKYYKGVLSALGRMNPATYGEDSILITPYGIYRDQPKASNTPISNLIKNNSVKKILWFGGIYPWFDLGNLVDAVKILNTTVPVQLIIVGAKNPFNDHPDFVSKYDKLIQHIADTSFEDKVILQDWVKFEDRVDWYLDSDLVVVINRIGEENELAWRTRLVDFMWASLPVVTNGGDPLGETLIDHNAAIRLIGLSPESIAQDLKKALEDKAKLGDMKKQLAELKTNYYWDAVTILLTKKITDHYQPQDRRLFGEVERKSTATGSRSTLSKLYSKARMLPGYSKKYGWKNTYFVIRTVATNRLKMLNLPGSKSPRIIFIAHQLDISGAPFVFVDTVTHLKAKHPKLPVEFYTFNPAHYSNIIKLNKIGIKPKIFLSRDIGFSFNSGDVVVLNTVGHTMVLKDSIFSALKTGIIRQLVWYIHEDQPELIFSASEAARVKSLLDSQKITMFMAGKQTRDSYRKFFNNEQQIKLQPYKVTMPQKYHGIREAKDFDALRFVLPGTVADGRKGHTPIMYAFINFKDKYYDKNPDMYRDFKLTFVGLGDDFLSRQILNHAPKELGDRFVYYDKISHEACMDVIHESNVTICYSLREALPLFVFEGMYTGHPLLRNDSSGMNEQLEPGKNGLYLETKDYDQVVETLERILNKKKISNEELTAMSKRSYVMAAKQADNDYSTICRVIYNAFNK